MKNKIAIIIIILFIVICGYVYFLYRQPSGYKTIQECEQKTGEQCIHDFGDVVLPSDPTLLKIARECMARVPSGWFPVSQDPHCSWPLK